MDNIEKNSMWLGGWLLFCAAVVYLMIVVGGKNSSNTHKLKLLCDKKGIDAYHIESHEELKRDWFEGKDHAGITAGTSTPFNVIDKVFDTIQVMTEGL